MMGGPQGNKKKKKKKGCSSLGKVFRANRLHSKTASRTRKHQKTVVPKKGSKEKKKCEGRWMDVALGMECNSEGHHSKGSKEKKKKLGRSSKKNLVAKKKEENAALPKPAQCK